MIQLSSKNDESSFVMTSSLLIKNFKIDKFGDFSSHFDYNSRTDIFRDDISLIINQCHLQATEGSLRRTQSVRQPRSALKQSALVKMKTKCEILWQNCSPYICRKNIFSVLLMLSLLLICIYFTKL